MSVCGKKHYQKNNSRPIPCYYIAGVCVTNPMTQGPQEMFLRTTYPFFHGPTYEGSKHQQSTMLPINLPVANYNK